MWTRKAQQELIQAIVSSINNNSLEEEQDYIQLLGVARKSGISMYEANLFIKSQLNKRKRTIVNTDGITQRPPKIQIPLEAAPTPVPENKTHTTPKPDTKDVANRATKTPSATGEQKQIEFYKKANRMLKKLSVGAIILIILTFLADLAGFIDFLAFARGEIHEDQIEKLSMEDILQLSNDFDKNNEVYYLYYFDVSASTRGLDTKLTDFTNDLSRDPDYSLWLEYAKDKDAKTKLAAWLMANPTSRIFGEEDDVKPQFTAYFFAKNAQPLLTDSKFTKELNQQNVEAVLQRLSAIKSDQYFDKQTLFGEAFTSILYNIYKIRQDPKRKNSKHVIVTILSDFCLDDLKGQSSKDVRDVPNIREAIDKLTRLTDVSIEFNLLRLEPSSANENLYGDLDDKLVNTIQQYFDNTTIYNIQDVFLNLDKIYNSEGVKNMFLSINAPSIHLPDYSEYTHHLQISKNKKISNTHIVNPQLKYNNAESSKTVMILFRKSENGVSHNGDSGIKYDQFNCSSKKPMADSEKRLMVGRMENESFVPPYALRFVGTIPSDTEDDFELMMYHRGIDKKFFIPLLQN